MAVGSLRKGGAIATKPTMETTMAAPNAAFVRRLRKIVEARRLRGRRVAASEADATYAISA
jgi:hypothetical protein